MGNTIWKSLKRIGKLKTINNMSNQQFTGDRLVREEMPNLTTGFMSTGLSGNTQSYVVGYDAARTTSSKREVVIIPLERGYNVKVGCTTVAFETIESLVAKLAEYLKDPAAAERKWNEGTFFENK